MNKLKIAQIVAMVLMFVLVLSGIWVSAWWLSAKFFSTAALVFITICAIEQGVIDGGKDMKDE